MLKPLLIEIGVEELPAVALLKELKNIEKKWLNVLESRSLICEFEFFYTPRRLVLWHREFQTHQKDSEIEFFGAPLSIAFKDSKPTQAALSFAKKCGADITDISTSFKNKKEVLYYKKQLKGESAVKLLPSMIAEWIKSLDFGKSMRWGSCVEKFIRPIRWINVMLDDDLINMNLFNISSSKQTYQHRTISFEPQFTKTIFEYFKILKNGGVILYQDERREMILDKFAKIQEDNDIKIEIDEELLNEVIAITEYPTPLLGNFDSDFLILPPEVIMTSMKEHQRYFPVFKDGRLTNSFIVVSNAKTHDFSKVIQGNEKVLRPRLSDALFFYKNDLKHGLSIDGLEKVLFMDVLGSVKDKIMREVDVVSELYELYKDKHDISLEILKRATTLAKADLVSEMVYEFTELQGIMGYYYALAFKEDERVALAIKEQYLPSGEDSKMPSTLTSGIVAMAIKIDTLLALFSINQIPTGSRDPFALRRSVNGIIRITLAFNLKFDIVKIFSRLCCKYNDFDISRLELFFIERIRRFYKVNPSIIEAVLSSGERELLAIDKKIFAVYEMVESDNFSKTFSTFKRLANIIKDIDLSDNFIIDTSLFKEDAERQLYNAYQAYVASSFEDYTQELDALLLLKPYLDNYFEHVLINTDDENVKQNRKASIALIYKSFLSIADIKEITL